MNSPSPYPVALKLAQRPCLVVGGGRVAARKVRDLLDAGAQVTVVAPEPVEAIDQLAHRITLHRRAYRPGDEAGAFLVFAATDDAQVNRDVAVRAQQAGALVNAADAPDRCDFFIPAHLRRGDLMITVSTGGAAPSYARELRQQLESQIGPEHAEALALVTEARTELLENRDLTSDQRGELMRRIVRLPLVKIIRSEGTKRARKEIARCISRSSD